MSGDHQQSFGPIPREKFAEIINAPHGKAAELIRTYDPLWGRDNGDGVERKWKVKLSREITEIGFATVMAVTEEGAKILADALDEHDIDWQHEYSDHGIVESVEPAP